MLDNVTPLKRTTNSPFVARVPGSKSFTNRALVIAAQRRGTTAIDAALHSEDTELLSECLNRFRGLTVTKTSTGFAVRRDREQLLAPDEELYIGGAGTPPRLLFFFSAGGAGATPITGDEGLPERPLGHFLQSFATLCSLSA